MDEKHDDKLRCAGGAGVRLPEDVWECVSGGVAPRAGGGGGIGSVPTNDVSPATRASILADAAKCVCKDRESRYGTPEDSFKMIAELWTTYSGYELTAHDVAIMMALLKVARISTGHGGVDSYVDLAGYAACAGEIAGAKGN